MKARPILFQHDMAKALWEGRKTQTRREIARLLRFGAITEFGRSNTPGYDWCFRDREARWHEMTHAELLTYCPYGMPGDLLWVRETWVHTEAGIWTVSDAMRWPFRSQVAYRADGENPGDQWFPSIHMPRWASRMTLRLTEVRVKRIQDISEKDARAEGCGPWPTGGMPYLEAKAFAGTGLYRESFRDLWIGINGSGRWDANPFVWVLAFDVIRENVDSVLMEQAA